jgi:hypothetical protein
MKNIVGMMWSPALHLLQQCNPPYGSFPNKSPVQVLDLFTKGFSLVAGRQIDFLAYLDPSTSFRRLWEPFGSDTPAPISRLVDGLKSLEMRSSKEELGSARLH